MRTAAGIRPNKCICPVHLHLTFTRMNPTPRVVTVLENLRCDKSQTAMSFLEAQTSGEPGVEVSGWTKLKQSYPMRPYPCPDQSPQVPRVP